MNKFKNERTNEGGEDDEMPCVIGENAGDCLNDIVPTICA